MFRASLYYNEPCIYEVDAKLQSPKMVLFGNYVYRKISKISGFFETFEGAREFLLKVCENRIIEIHKIKYRIANMFEKEN